MRRLIFIGLALLAGTGLILGIWAHLAIGAKWSRLEERVRELEVETATPRSAKGWEHYETAMSLVQNTTHLLAMYDPLYEGEMLLKYRTTLEKLAPAFESLRSGARAQASRPANVQIGYEGNWLGRSAILQARLCRGEGRLREAADLVLSAATFARDIADEGNEAQLRTGLEILDDAWEELRLLIADKGLSEADGAEIARRLEALDRRFPRVERSMILNVHDHARQLLRDSSKFEYLGTTYPLRPGLRSLFSVRLHKANAFERWDYYLDRFRGSDTKPWSDIERITKEISQEIQETDVDALKLPPVHFADFMGTTRESLAQLRLLRAALAFRPTGSAPPLADPFGGTIDVEVSGPSLTAWSKGMGGMDHQKSGWKRAGDMLEALDRGSLRIDLKR